MSPERLSPMVAFGRAGPMEVDMGCGKGRFLLAHAAAHPDTLFLGIDRLHRRLWKVDSRARRRGLDNVRLLRLDGLYAARHLLPPGSVRAIYLFFPDPWPKRRHHRRRLYTAEFVDSVHAALESGGRLHMATDHRDYFDAMQEVMAGETRFEKAAALELPEAERTDFERIFRGLGLPVYRSSFRKKGGA